MNTDNFLRELRALLRDLKPGSHEIRLMLNGLAVCFKLTRVADCDKMVVNFHGAINRATRSYPTYNKPFRSLSDVNQLSVADPSMQLDRPFNIAWYAGHEGFNTQEILTQALMQFREALEIRRTVYFGSSGGGFAALYFSHADPESIVVAANPQTRIARYHARLVTEYRTQCWPRLKANGDIEQVTCADVRPLYEGGFQNTVIYSQSLGDEVHMVRQMLPFVRSAARSDSRKRLVPATYFTGEMGHSPSPSVSERWVRAACLAPTQLPADILRTWHALGSEDAPKRSAKLRQTDTGPVEKAKKPFLSEDLTLTDQLLALHQEAP